MADGEAIVIAELEGTGLQVFLEDSSLPTQLESASELRSVVTHYPGTSAASTQIMGVKDDDIVLEGQFRDVWIGFEGGAMARWQALRRLLIGQRYCELSWGSTFVRRGFVKRVEQTFRRGADIGYRLTFQVDEADEAEVVAPTAFPEDSTTNDLDALLAEVQARSLSLSEAVDVLNLVQAVV
jgi:hypothetical protein